MCYTQLGYNIGRKTLITIIIINKYYFKFYNYQQNGSKTKEVLKKN